MTYRTKLIEVSLPLEAISEASVREKSIRHGHPSTLHLWWSRKPLAASRAVLFASLVDDPSAHPDIFETEAEQATERERLFAIMRDLVKWENSNNEKVLQQAREEIKKSAPDGELPPFLDPFAGGGSIPLEAQRLGLESHASDLNPVAVLLNKALIEIPPKFANLPPVNPEAQNTLVQKEWKGAQGLADDIRYYGKWMRDEAERRIGHLYPKAQLPKEYGGSESTAIAWLWVRIVTCPNPACSVQMPLANKWWLSKKKGKETWVEPQIDHATVPATISYSIMSGKGKPEEGTVNRQGAKCIACGEIVPFEYIRDEGKAGRMGEQMIAIVAEGKKGRIYIAPNDYHDINRFDFEPSSIPETDLPQQALGFRVQLYGMVKHKDLFTSRQLMALTTFSDLVQEAKEKISSDLSHCWSDNRSHLSENATVEDYADAIALYLGINVSRLANRCSSICFWDATGENVQQVFARQAIPMVWDFVEANPFSNSTGNFMGQLDYLISVVEVSPCRVPGYATQQDAVTISNKDKGYIVSTDPPYYDYIGYADLSDFFYIWLRRSLSDIYCDLFGTMLVPKAQELVANPYRFNGDKKEAQQFFEKGLSQVFDKLRLVQHEDYPLVVYYAFKQSEKEEQSVDENGISSNAISSTGWETMLGGLIKAGFTITGTWPIRTELITNLKKYMGSLASSIALVCRPRPINAPAIPRRQFINELRNELSEALKTMQHDGIAPVDLAQASIGPGMKIYSQYSQVLESNGSPLSVRTALQLINRELDGILAAQEGEYDVETRWAVSWFEECAMDVGPYGRAETLSKAKNVALRSLVEAGLLETKAGKARLLKREELASKGEFEILNHRTPTVWEVMQRTIHSLDKQGTTAAGKILVNLPEYSEAARDLAYRLYNICERKGWSGEGLYYNMLVSSWSDIEAQARTIARSPLQAALSFDA